MSTNFSDVLIVGAGPTGLSLATALAAQGVKTTIIDREAEGANSSRAAVVHARTLEVLESIGVTDSLVRLGIHATRFTIRDRDRILIPVYFDNLPTQYPYTLMISQAVTEAVLRDRYAELGGQVLWRRGLVDVAQNDQYVTATLEEGTTIQARYLVGADGMHSRVRERAGIPFPGGRYGESFSLSDVRLTGAVPRDEVILYFSPAGLVVVAPLPGGIHRIVATVDSAPEQPDIDYIQTLLDTRGPKSERFVVNEIVWGSRFRVHHRVVDKYRAGRILLAGDAAHVHSPAGGQGMNTGIQDAMALAQSLPRALMGNSDGQLNNYEAVRRPIAKEVVVFTDRLTRLATVDRGLRPVRNIVLKFLALVPAFRSQLAWRLSGLVYR